MKRLAAPTVTWGKGRTALLAWILTQALGPTSPGIAQPGLPDGPRDGVSAPTTTDPGTDQRASDIDAAFLSAATHFSALQVAAAQISLRTTKNAAVGHDAQRLQTARAWKFHRAGRAPSSILRSS